MVVQWVLDLERQGHAPSHTQLREMAVQISINSGGPDNVGNHWVSRFLQRHSSLSTKRRRNMNAIRSKEQKERHYKNNTVCIRSILWGLEPSNIWNMDETGLYLRTVSNGRVLESFTKRTYKKTPGNFRDWVTAIEAISAVGVSLPPLVIFKGQNLQSS
jgi:Tc5 transposase DNA-binding domain